MVLTLGEEHYQVWGKLLHSVQSGQPAFHAVYSSPMFEYFERNPSAAGIFNAAMTDFTSQAALAAIAAYDFSAIRGAADTRLQSAIPSTCNTMPRNILAVTSV